MSLVAYDVSSSEESDTECCTPKKDTSNQRIQCDGLEGDSENHASKLALELKLLPTSSSAHPVNEKIEEEDDEFLHKKAIPPAPKAKGPVKISIPSLKDFADVDDELSKQKRDANNSLRSKGCGLLSQLPKPRSELNFLQKPSAEVIKPQIVRPSFIPDTVRYRRPAHNTEAVDGINDLKPKKPQSSNLVKEKQTLEDHSEACESSEDESMDFFSLNSSSKLPEVSGNEIELMVAKHAAEVAVNQSKYLNDEVEEAAGVSQYAAPVQPVCDSANKRSYDIELNDDAIKALAGSNAKRRRKEAESIQIIDISSADVQPSREEWLRTATSASTAYQATGVLKDDEVLPGTRRKHQITYLAHQAKSNEAELQAMWAANRTNRRATQSKYGF